MGLRSLLKYKIWCVTNFIIYMIIIFHIIIIFYHLPLCNLHFIISLLKLGRYSTYLHTNSSGMVLPAYTALQHDPYHYVWVPMSAL